MQLPCIRIGERVIEEFESWRAGLSLLLSLLARFLAKQRSKAKPSPDKKKRRVEVE